MSDVFLSHSSKDVRDADRLVAALEDAGISCWLSHRDVPPGTSYPREIIAAINSAKTLVLLLTANSNESAHVHREVERAANAGLPIITFRSEHTELSPELEYFLSTSQWLDATVGTWEVNTAGLAKRILEVLGRETLSPLPERSSVRPTRRALQSFAAVLLLAAASAAAWAAVASLRSNERPDSARSTSHPAGALNPSVVTSPAAGPASWQCAEPAGRRVPSPSACDPITSDIGFLYWAFPNARACKPLAVLNDGSGGGKLTDLLCDRSTAPRSRAYKVYYALWRDRASAEAHYRSPNGHFQPHHGEPSAYRIGPGISGLRWQTSEGTNPRYKATFLYSDAPFSITVTSNTSAGFDFGWRTEANPTRVTRNAWLRARPAQ